ncbi:alginate lyase family protein [Streptomyces sp. 184]|uniref:alginate lyase family protein n=1 Tax=Streptomyces sp. 184 TaxID=1827526 RepID=UPI003891D3A5
MAPSRIPRGVAVLLLALLPVVAAGSPAEPPPRGQHSRAAAPFRHPGVLVSGPQLRALRARVQDGDEPFRAFRAMRRSHYGQLSYAPRPVPVVECRPNVNPGVGCLDEREDAIAAYTHALIWAVTRDRAHAGKAVQIMDAWSARLTDHTEGNAPLQAAWAGSTWARAAELIRSTYGGWPPAGVHRFERLLRDVYLPEVTVAVPDHNGNWDLTLTDAATGIAVFLDDRAAYDEALRRFRARVPAYFYVRADGPLPRPPPGGQIDTPEEIAAYWFGQRTYPEGLAQETCRNLMHVGYALAATAHIAETALHQGTDLYAEVAPRITAALELHSRYQLGERPPASLCGGRVERTMGPDLEVAYHHYHGRLGADLPQTAKLLARQRPAGTDDLFVAWETLTHAADPG